MNPPKKHHYVPQFFLKPWLTNGMLSCYIIKEDKTFKSPTRKTALENNLYMFDGDEIESQFLSPFIDNLLDNDVIKVRNKSWKDLSSRTKSNFFKFLVLLDARNPQSLKSISSGYEEIKNKVELTKIEDGFEDLINNEHYVFLCIAIHELNLKVKKPLPEENNVFKTSLYNMYMKISSLIDDNELFPSFQSILIKKNLHCLEINIERDRFVTSTVPVRKMGNYNGNYLTNVNISPRKSLIFSNNIDYINKFVDLTTEQKINEINYFNINKMPNSFQPERIILPSDIELSYVKNMLKRKA